MKSDVCATILWRKDPPIRTGTIRFNKVGISQTFVLSRVTGQKIKITCNDKYAGLPVR